MGWIRCSSVPTTPRFWVLNPDMSDAINAVSYTPKYAAYAPYVYKINNNANSGLPNMCGTSTFNGTSQAVVYRNGYEVGGMHFAIQIPHNTYKKLYAYVEVTAYGTGTWRQAYLTCSSSMALGTNGIPSSTIKSVILASGDYTSAQINAQSGVVINSTNNLLLSAQVVEIDVSGFTTDWYFGCWNCDRGIGIRSVYLE